MTYEKILNQMLKKVPKDFDKREGSIIYNALAPAAFELAQMYIQKEIILNETFADTATRKYLIKRVAERGIIPDPATKAVLRGEFNIDIPIGSRFSLDDLNYVAIEKITTGVFKMQCETAGEIGNTKYGLMMPIDYINGLTTAELTEMLIPGEDEEDTENLRERYFSSLQSQAFGGNVADYKEKILTISGVGGVKVYPVWNGGGTVKLVITDSTYSVPSSTLIDLVQSQVDPVTNQGKGIGFAPIGHVVTVEGVTSTSIDITTTITYQEGWKWEDVKLSVYKAIDKYFNELASTWDNETSLIIRISQIETRLLNLTGILDITNTTINDNASNLNLGVDNIPIRGDISG